MDVGTLEKWLWDAACEIPGPLDAPQFKDYILPLVFLSGDEGGGGHRKGGQDYRRPGAERGMSPLSEPEERVAVDVFKAEAHGWAAQIRVEPQEINVRRMKRKWASASFAGRLTLDTDLLTGPPEKRAEVIVHELVHLKVGTHGPLFRSLVGAHLETPLWLIDRASGPRITTACTPRVGSGTSGTVNGGVRGCNNTM